MESDQAADIYLRVFLPDESIEIHHPEPLFVALETQAATCDQSTESESMDNEAFVSGTVTVWATCIGMTASTDVSFWVAMG